MRIGMVTACYKPVINGVTRMVSLYKEHLEAAGHEVTIFTLGNPDPNDEPGVVRSPGLMLGDYGYYVSMRYSSEAQALLQEMDIIHCHHLFMSVEMAHRYGRSPIVYTNHTRYDLYTGSVISLPQPAADAIMRQVWPEFTDFADVVITPSAGLRDVMLEFGVRRPIELIENGVDLRPFHHPTAPLAKADLGVPETAVLVTYVGRLSPEKDVDILLDQFAIAKDVVPNLHLMIIGKGSVQADLQKQAKQLGVTDSVTFTGPVAYEEVANYLAAADLFATASVTEVHPLTVIEAMAAGLPVVAVSSPGIVDTVTSDQSGLLTTKPAGGLAAALVGLASNDARRKQMAQAARQESERFDIYNTIQRTIKLYERLQEERPDLKRKKMHGRRIFDSERLQPVVEQLGKLLWPAEKEPSSRRWFLPSSMTQAEQRPHDN
ncbi:glycosyltransferase [Candidatus Leptofilum sp.]|uniref:glycosyltransferase n=1 Tax=Candidatus Leptofilum sp. TaxID=3241576 RepID=UPI003B5C4DA2